MACCPTFDKIRIFHLGNETTPFHVQTQYPSLRTLYPGLEYYGEISLTIIFLILKVKLDERNLPRVMA